MSYFPDKKEFLKLSKKGNLIPIFKEILADLETPVSCFLKICSQDKYAYLLESVEGKEKIARFSFLASNPRYIIKNKENLFEIIKINANQKKVTKFKIETNPLNEIKKLMRNYRFVSIKGLPRFCGGLVGFIGYDMVRFFEDLPKKNKDDLKLEDIFLMLTDTLVIFDHVNHKIKIISCVYLNKKTIKKNKSILEEYDKATKKIDKIREKIVSPIKSVNFNNKNVSAALNESSNFTKKGFKKIVRKAKQYIKEGDIIQAVLSQRFQIKLTQKPFNVYRMLRSINPSPYMYFLKFDKLYLIGSSPELLVRCEDGVVQTRPIAGTRARGKTEAQDKQLEIDLLNDPKEKAEHIMLVDLGRNDLGRVCIPGTVELSEFMSVEKYSHVMHMVTNVTGRLRKDKDIFDVLTACFPAGTVTGAPKVRAMQIIEELENIRRGVYAGCVGYFSFSGNLDTCITIRTIIIKGGSAYIQAGAGIVADSKPEQEFKETLNKAKALILCLTKTQLTE